MDQEPSTTTPDLMRACDAPAARVSQISSALGIRGRRQGGRRPRTYSTEDAVRIVLTRRLQMLGVGLPDAAKAVRALTFEDLHRIVVTDQPQWLVVSEGGRAELCGVDRVYALAEDRACLQGFRVASVYQAIQDVLTARLERAEQEAAQSIVTTCTASPGTTGITLSSSLQVSIYRGGKGLRVQLSADAARSLARRLEATADATEAGPPAEAIN